MCRAVRDPAFIKVSMACGSQMAKTDGVNLNCLGHQFADDPQPALYIGPTQKNAEAIGSDRLAKMIASAPKLADGLLGGQRDKITEKFINGARLGIGWAGSATELASHPAKLVVIDEYDRMEDIKGEGDPVELGEARTATYNGTVLVTSTPLEGNVEAELDTDTGLEHWAKANPEEVFSPTWRLQQEGTRHEYAVPCVECDHYYIPRFKLLAWPSDSSSPSDDDCGIACPHCGCINDETAKDWQNQHGVFVAPRQSVKQYEDGDECAVIIQPDKERVEVTYGEYARAPDSNEIGSFWISGLCSNWRSYGRRVRNYLRAVKSGQPGRIQAAVNTGFGELYRPVTDTPDWREVSKLKGKLSFYQLSPKAQVITAGIDVQKYGLYFAMRAWGANGENWQVSHGYVEGDTRRPEVYSELLEILRKPAGGVVCKRAMLDTGFNPSVGMDGAIDPDSGPRSKNILYDVCRTNKSFLKAAKGYAVLPKPVRTSQIDITTASGKTLKSGLTLYSIDSDYFKSAIHDVLAQMVEEGEGATVPARMHFSEEAEDDYFMQLVSEVRTVTANGSPRWKRQRKANHYLDCEMLAAAAAHSLNLQSRLTEKTLDRYRSGAAAPNKKPTDGKRKAPTKPKPKRNVNSGGWVQGGSGWTDSGSSGKWV